MLICLSVSGGTEWAREQQDGLRHHPTGTGSREKQEEEPRMGSGGTEGQKERMQSISRSSRRKRQK